MKNPDAKVEVIVGAQWGDEGKGKFTDLLAERADAVFKANGGRNAGHTVENPLGEFALHLVPAGIFYPHTDNIIGPGVALSLRYGIKEILELKSKGVSTERLYISPKAHLVLDFHEFEDSLFESYKGEGKVGTTGTGNGPLYTDKVSRVGLRAELLKHPNKLMDKLAALLAIKRNNHGAISLPKEFAPEYYEDLIRTAAEVMGPKVCDTDQLTQSHLSRGSRLLIEGSHGSLLDIDNGTYPFVTSTSCTVNGLLMGAGLPRVNIHRAYGVFKAYQTRVGGGPMPSELNGQLEDWLRENGREYGTTTGRPRRVGYFDGVAARYSQMKNGYTDVVLTKLDTLTNIAALKVATAYRMDGEEIADFPTDSDMLAACQPVYKEFKSWQGDITKITSFDDLPKEAQHYIKMGIMRHIPNANLAYIGTGPGRNQGIQLVNLN